MRLMICASRLHRAFLCWFDTTIVAYEQPVIETQMLKWTNESVAREEKLWNGNVRCSQETSWVMFRCFGEFRLCWLSTQIGPCAEQLVQTQVHVVTDLVRDSLC